MIRHFLLALLRRLRRPWRMLDARRMLSSDRRAVAMLEFAISLPVCLIALLGGSDLAWYAITWQQVAQIASITADNASRLGEDTGKIPVKVAESQINDVLTGALWQQDNLDLLDNGRIVITSLEQNNSGQYINNWQRCVGKLSYQSLAGTQNTSVTSDSNDSNPAASSSAVTNNGTNPLQALSNGAIMYVEVAYNYKPMFSTFWYGNSTLIVERVGFIARDARLTHTIISPPGTNEPQLAYPYNDLASNTPSVTTSNNNTPPVIGGLNTC